VPYFFEGGTVLGLERGDQLLPLLDRPIEWVVLVLPGFGVSTRDAFGWWDSRHMRAKDTKGGTDDTKDTEELRNDLEPIVAARHPEIARVVRALKRAGASQAAMTGSGSTVFGLFRSEKAAARVARAVETRAQKTLITTTIDRKRYGRASLPSSG